MLRHCFASLIGLALLAGAGEAHAATLCYQAFDAGSGVPRALFLRLPTREAGTLVAANEGGTSGQAQILSEVDGYSTIRTGLVANARPVVEMAIVEGTALVIAGQGAQMSLWRSLAPSFARDLRLGMVNASATPRCREFRLRSS